MNALLTGACPGSEDIAAFVVGSLGSPAEKTVVAHVADCEACRALLSALARAGGDPARAVTMTSPFALAPADDRPLAPGTCVGRYIVLARLGAGGMGVVYAAHDPELDRKIALKLLRCDTLDAGARALLRDRLRREAQAMARLAHPHVVGVHDVGSFADQVFVAMELVDGMTLARWVAAEKRGWRDVLAVYVAAGRGLAAAHAAGLVHRDFKPENVLVGSDGRVRVTDFGLARADDVMGACGAEEAAAAGDDAQALTRTGMLLGTPFYMAPEQYLSGTADARSDQWSFCVALHVALTGVHPLDVDGAGGLAGAIAGHRLRTPSPAAGLPRWLRRVLARGLAAEPSARFPSMHELLAALAHDPGRRRRRVLVTLAVVALLAAAALAVVTERRERALLCTGAAEQMAGIWDGTRAASIEQAFLATGKPYAPAAYAEVARRLDAQAAAWTAMHTEACAATRLRGEQPEAVLALRMSCLEDRRRELRALTDRLALADTDLVERAPRVVLALGDVTTCAGTSPLESPLPPPSDASLRARIDALRAELAEISVLEQAGRYPAGCERVRPLAQAARETQHRPLEAEVLLVQGRLESACGDDAAAEHALEGSVWAAEASHHDAIAARAWLALMHLHESGKTRHADALALEPRVTAALERLGGDAALEGELNVVVGRVYLNTSDFERARERGERALALLERRFGADDLRVADALALLGDVAYSRGGADGAPFFERELAIKRKVYGGSHPEVARGLRAISRVRNAQGRYLESCAASDEAMAITRAALGPRHRVMGSHYNDLAVCRYALGDWPAARAAVDEALAIDAETIGRGHITYAIHLMTLSLVLMATADDAGAEKALREAAGVIAKSLGPDDARMSSAHNLLARALHRQGKDAEARTEVLGALAIEERRNGGEDPYVYEPLWTLGEIELALGAPERALPSLEKARRLATHAGIDASNRAEIDAALARAIVVTRGDTGRARELASAAHAVLAADTRRPREHAALDRWLARQGWTVVEPAR